MKTFITFFAFLLSVYATAAGNGLDCKNAISTSIDNGETYTFPEEEERLYFSFSTNDSAYFALNISPVIGYAFLDNLVSYSIYEYEECDDLILIYDALESEREIPHDTNFWNQKPYFHYLKLNPNTKYLILLKRDGGLPEVSFYQSITFYSLMSCSLSPSVCQDQLILNEGFEEQQQFNISQIFPFAFGEVCSWEQGDNGPQVETDLSINPDRFAKLRAIYDDNYPPSQIVDIHESIFQNIGPLNTSKEYVLSFRIRESTDVGLDPLEEFKIHLVDQSNIPAVDPIIQTQRVGDVYSVTPRQVLVDYDQTDFTNTFTRHTVCFTPSSAYDAVLLYTKNNTRYNDPTLGLKMRYSEIFIDDVTITEWDATLGPDVLTGCPAIIGPECKIPEATYSWSPSTGLSDPNIANPVASPTSDQTYTVTVSLPGTTGCSDIVKSIFVKGNPNNIPYDHGFAEAITIDELKAITGFTPGPGGDPDVIANKNLYFAGDLTVDANIIFRNCNFFMSNNTRINVNNFSEFKFETPDNLNNYFIKGCNGSFWDGVYVDGFNSSKIEFIGYKKANQRANFEFSNSEFGVQLSEQPKALIQYVAFDKNNRSIHIVGSNSTSTEEININSCTFDCSSPLGPIGSQYYPSTSIYIEDFYYSITGNTDDCELKSLNISDFAYVDGKAGEVVIVNSDVKIDGYDFRNFNNEGPQIVSNYNNHAIRSSFDNTSPPNTFVVQNCTFLDNYFGISLTTDQIDYLGVPSAIALLDNVFNSNTVGLGTAIRVMKLNAGVSFVIDHAEVYDLEVGIYVEDSENLTIKNCTLDMEVQSPGTYTDRQNKYSTGIFVNNFDSDNLLSVLSSTPHIEIHDNLISHGKVGIQTEFAYANIHDNKILDMNDNMSGPCGFVGGQWIPCPSTPYGIRAMNQVVSVEQNKIENNSSLYGSSQPSANPSIVGISLENSVSATSFDSQVNCNKIENTGIGLRFVGDCGTGTTAENNTLQDHYYGFVLKNNGEIGNVGNSTNACDNEWKWTPSQPRSHTFSDNSDGRLCTLYTKNSYPYNPSINIALDHTNGFALREVNTVSNGSTLSCTAPLLTSQPSDPKGQLSQQKSGGNGNINSNSRQRIKGNSSRYIFAPDSMLLLNKQLLYGQAMKDSTLLTDTILKSFVDSMQRTPNNRILSRSKQSYRNTNVRNSAINNFEANLILISPILERIEANSALSSYDTSNLILVANKCPFYDGIAVYQARGALYQLGYPLISNACESTIAVQGNQKRLGASEKKENSFAIYPNPAKELVNLSFQVKDGEEVFFELHDLTGRKVMRKRLKTNSLHHIELKAVHHGIYIYRLLNVESILESGKLVIE